MNDKQVRECATAMVLTTHVFASLCWIYSNLESLHAVLKVPTNIGKSINTTLYLPINAAFGAKLQFSAVASTRGNSAAKLAYIPYSDISCNGFTGTFPGAPFLVDAGYTRIP